MVHKLLLVVAICIWSATFVIQKFCLAYITPAELFCLRLMIGMPTLFTMLRLKGVPLSLERSELLQMSLASLVLGSHFMLQISGLQYTSATNTAWIVAIEPLIVILLAFLFLREKISRLALRGIAVASVGVFLLLTKGSLSAFKIGNSWGDILVLGSAFTWAIYTIVSRSLVRRRDPLLITFWLFTPSFVLLLVFILASSDLGHIAALPKDIWLSIVFLGIFGTALAHWFWQSGVAALGSARAGIYLYLEPLGTTLIAVPFLHEEFGLITAAGGALVLLGVIIAERLGAA